MNEVPLPEAVLAAAHDREGGASEVAARAVDGLLQLAGDRARLDAAVAVLLAGQSAMAPMWHLARAAGAPDPAGALRRLRRLLRTEADAAVAVAAAWLAARPGPVRTVSHSSLVDRVLARLGEPARRGAGAGLVGADAIGPSALLNATGTGAVAAQVPTLVVTTSLKLVPASAFERLTAPGFEAVPLAALAAVALGGELLAPAEAGVRAAALEP
ncbi:MAG TPA: hypothetical protein VF486_05675 [Actinomycetes bacterium]